MKKIIIVPALALALQFGLATPTQALSCLDPESSIDYYIDNDSTVIVTAKAQHHTDFINEKASEEFMQDSGYTGVMLEVSERHKGYVDDKVWVYFQKDSTWGYLCAGEPPAIGTEAVYVLNQSDSRFDLVTVSQTYERDSELAETLLEEIAKRVEPESYIQVEFSAQERFNQLITDLREFWFIATIMLAEAKFWKSY